MPEPRVTFVIPCFNHGRFVAAAVESCLRQRDADVRVVIVDDGSTDGSTPDACDALASDRVHVMHQVNRGLPAARNAGIARARELGRDWHAEYLAFLDADDFIEETFAKELADALGDAPSDVSHAYCQERLVELGHGTWKVPEWDPDLLLITNLHPVTCLVRWGAIDTLSAGDAARPRAPFDETMRLGYEDWELWIAFASRGFRGVRVPKVLFNWRRHSNETMIFDAVRRHDELYAHIIRAHPEMYGPRLETLLRRTNNMLRAWNMNWLDESGEPIPLINLKRARDELIRLREQHHRLGADVGTLKARAEQAEREALTLAAERDVARDEAARLRTSNARIANEYERMGAVRLHHASHRLLASLPAFLSRPLKRAAGLTTRLIASAIGAGRDQSRDRAQAPPMIQQEAQRNTLPAGVVPPDPLAPCAPGGSTIEHAPDPTRRHTPGARTP
ncbi:MAG: glycosyltransferase [Phycisphaeraceae bacterium]|nr:glycosyltransferase [Phycisphaeraceae bacterium]MBX3368104.1 glycosyltransferase [Phycisphaeraceae bacterium]